MLFYFVGALVRSLAALACSTSCSRLLGPCTAAYSVLVSAWVAYRLGRKGHRAGQAGSARDRERSVVFLAGSTASGIEVKVVCDGVVVSTGAATSVPVRLRCKQQVLIGRQVRERLVEWVYVGLI